MKHGVFYILVLLLLAPLSTWSEDLCVSQVADEIVVPPSSCFACEIIDNGPALARVRTALGNQLAMAERKFVRVNLLLQNRSLDARFSFRARQRVKVLRAILRSNASILQDMLDEVPLSVSACAAPQILFCSGLDYSSITSGILSISNIVNEEVLGRLIRLQARLKSEQNEDYALRVHQKRALRLFDSVTNAVMDVETLHMQCGA